MKRIPLEALVAKFKKRDEFAIIDAREEGLFARAHLLAATNLPLSRLELIASEAIPRADTDIVLCDDCDGVVERAGHALSRLGYENVSALEGGVAACAAAASCRSPIR